MTSLVEEASVASVAADGGCNCLSHRKRERRISAPLHPLLFVGRPLQDIVIIFMYRVKGIGEPRFVVCGPIPVAVTH